MTLKELKDKFVYVTDKKRLNVYEDWSLPKIQKDGKIYGDCDDYILCVIFYCRIFVTIYFAVNKKTNEGHVIGKYKNQFIDNNTKEFQNTPAEVYKIKRRITYAEMLYRMLLSKLGFYRLIQNFKKD